MTIRRLWYFLFLLNVLPAFVLESEATTLAEQGQSYKFSVRVGLVVLPVTVLDRRGDSVPGLEQQNFQVFENGVPQQIILFDHRDIPVTLGLIIDNSTSMAPKLPEVVLSALQLARASNPDDQIFVVHFNENVGFGLRPELSFARNLGDLVDAVSEARAQGKTALYDAITAGLVHLKQSRLKKKVLVVISDGGDNASTVTLPQTLRKAQSSEALIYTVGIFDEYDKDQNPKVLKQLARATGGASFFPKELRQLPDITRRIAHDVRTQYTIGYISTNPAADGTYRSIRVGVTADKRHGLIVRTRSGYVAGEESAPDPAGPNTGDR